MTKHCEVCHTVNRDRALYCRGCAGRFAQTRLATNPAVAPLATFGAIRNSSNIDTPPPKAASSHVPEPSLSRTWSNRLRVLMPAGAALSAALVVAQQWTPADRPRSQSAPALAQEQQRPAPTGAPAPAAAVAGSARESASSRAAAPASVPQESLLALTLEHNAREREPVEEYLTGNPPVILNAEAAEAAMPAVLASEQATEGDTVVPVTAKATSRSRQPAPRRVMADARPARQAASRPTAALAITGPCDRYNPFGEAICANTPMPGRQAPVAYSGLARQALAR